MKKINPLGGEGRPVPPAPAPRFFPRRRIGARQATRDAAARVAEKARGRAAARSAASRIEDAGEEEPADAAAADAEGDGGLNAAYMRFHQIIWKFAEFQQTLTLSSSYWLHII